MRGHKEDVSTMSHVKRRLNDIIMTNWRQIDLNIKANGKC